MCLIIKSTVCFPGIFHSVYHMLTCHVGWSFEEFVLALYQRRDVTILYCNSPDLFSAQLEKIHGIQYMRSYKTPIYLLYYMLIYWLFDSWVSVRFCSLFTLLQITWSVHGKSEPDVKLMWLNFTFVHSLLNITYMGKFKYFLKSFSKRTQSCPWKVNIHTSV